MLCMYIEYIKKNIYVLHCVSLLFCQLLFFFYLSIFMASTALSLSTDPFTP